MDKFIKLRKHYNFKIIDVHFDNINIITLKSGLKLLYFTQSILIKKIKNGYQLKLYFDDNYYSKKTNNYLRIGPKIVFYSSKIFEEYNFLLAEEELAMSIIHNDVDKKLPLISRELTNLTLNNVKSINFEFDEDIKTVILEKVLNYDNLVNNSIKIINTVSCGEKYNLYEKMLVLPEHKAMVGCTMLKDEIPEIIRPNVDTPEHNVGIDTIKNIITVAGNKFTGFIDEEITGEIEIIANLFN